MFLHLAVQFEENNLFVKLPRRRQYFRSIRNTWGIFLTANRTPIKQLNIYRAIVSGLCQEDALWFGEIACTTYCVIIAAAHAIRMSSQRLSVLTYGAGWAGITNAVDHLSNGSNPGSAVLCELTKFFQPVLSPSCVAEDSRSGDRFQVGLGRSSPCLQLAFRLSAPLTKRCG